MPLPSPTPRAEGKKGNMTPVFTKILFWLAVLFWFTYLKVIIVLGIFPFPSNARWCKRVVLHTQTRSSSRQRQVGFCELKAKMELHSEILYRGGGKSGLEGEVKSSFKGPGFGLQTSCVGPLLVSSSIRYKHYVQTYANKTPTHMKVKQTNKPSPQKTKKMF